MRTVSAQLGGRSGLSQCTFGHLRRAAEAVGVQTGPDTSVSANRKVTDDAEMHSVVLGLEATQHHSHVQLLR